MYQGDDSRPQDQATDAIMTSLYRQLDQHDLPADAAFDIETGLRDLTIRMHRDLGDQPEHARQHEERLPAYATSGAPARQKAESLQDHGANDLARLETSSRVGTRFSIGIAAMALVSMALVAIPHMALATITAVTVINATTAAAGTLIHRTATAARHTKQRRDIAPLQRFADRDTTADAQPVASAPVGSRVHIDAFRGVLNLGGPIESPASSRRQTARLHHRVITALLAALTLGTAAAAAIGIAGILSQGMLTGYEITLLAPTAASILLLLTTWWWRTTDRPTPPAPSAPETLINHRPQDQADDWA